MADDNHENGTSNGDVPEIELIIKVSVPCAIENRHASETDRSERYVETIEREREEDGEKRRRLSHAHYGRGAANWFSFTPAGKPQANLWFFPPIPVERRDCEIDRSTIAVVG